MARTLTQSSQSILADIIARGLSAVTIAHTQTIMLSFYLDKSFGSRGTSSSAERIALFSKANTNDMMIYIILTTADLTEPNPRQVFIAKNSNI